MTKLARGDLLPVPGKRGDAWSLEPALTWEKVHLSPPLPQAGNGDPTAAVPDPNWQGLTDQAQSHSPDLESSDQFIAIGDYAGGGKTTQFRAGAGCTPTPPAPEQRPDRGVGSTTTGPSMIIPVHRGQRARTGWPRISRRVACEKAMAGSSRTTAAPCSWWMAR